MDDKDNCINCHMELWEEEIGVALDGEPIKLAHCNNTECPRYGLYTSLDLRVLGDDHAND